MEVDWCAWLFSFGHLSFQSVEWRVLVEQSLLLLGSPHKSTQDPALRVPRRSSYGGRASVGIGLSSTSSDALWSPVASRGPLQGGREDWVLVASPWLGTVPSVSFVCSLCLVLPQLPLLPKLASRCLPGLSLRLKPLPPLPFLEFFCHI